MTQQQRINLDNQLSNFKSFTDLHRYAFEHDIYFDNTEWQEYSEKFKKILKNREITEFNFDNLILPESFVN